MREVYALFSRYWYELPIFTFISVISKEEHEKRFLPPNNLIGVVAVYLGTTLVPEDEPLYAQNRKWAIVGYQVACTNFPLFEPVVKEGEMADFEEVG
jgi:hypothetical protein